MKNAPRSSRISRLTQEGCTASFGRPRRRIFWRGRSGIFCTITTASGRGAPLSCTPSWRSERHEGLPENADWLSRMALSIGDRSELLTVEKKRSGKKRYLRLILKNGDTGVIGVTRREAGSDTSDTNDANQEEIKWID